MPRTRAEVKKVESHPLSSQIGKLVQYYDEGCRFGYLEGIRKTNARIRVIVYKGTSARCVTIPLTDVKEIKK